MDVKCIGDVSGQPVGPTSKTGPTGCPETSGEDLIQKTVEAWIHASIWFSLFVRYILR